MTLLSASHAAGYIGEAVSQLEHALQAAELASRAGQPEHVVLASLLHDVGHLGVADAPSMDGLGAVAHEDLGADWLASLGFSSDVTELVRGHVSAKRYLVSTRPDYAARLSDASRRTLELQGGALGPEAAAALERDPRLKDMLRVRQYDDAAKVAGREVPPLDAYRGWLEAHLHRHA